MATPEVPTLLSNGVTTGTQLQRALGVSQPTFSRMVRELGEEIVRIGSGRGARYGLRRTLPGIGSSWPVVVVNQQGVPIPVGQMSALARNQYWFQGALARDNELSDGLPFFLQDLWPQGFIGRTLSRRFPELALPERVTDWNEEQVLRYLTQRGEDCVGNFLLGDESLQRYLRSTGEEPRLTAGQRAKEYPALAEAAIAGAPPGSSAGGEQPKFTTVLRGGGEEVSHVLVKFSPPVMDRVSQRWADLLVAEHVANKKLGEIAVVAASSELVTGGGRVFLESQRFDRTGHRGRIGVVSLAAVADHYIGRRDNWIAAVKRLQALRAVSATAVDAVRRIATFGQLIGNTDMHFGNLSFFCSFGTPLSLAPVYDMLPMMYAPVAGEELPQRQYEPPLPVADNLDLWPAIAERAVEYWREVAAHPLVSADFAQLARENAASLGGMKRQVF